MAGIYIHIPFCKKRCHYCDFYKTLDTGLCGGFVDALLLETDQRRGYLDSDEKVETIYFGGGTPSVMTIEQVRLIISKIYSNFKIDEKAEITFEINPDDAGKTYLKGLYREGINRLSIGVQSWSDNLLAMLNRRHNAQQAKKAIEFAREVGFDNISIDLIYGIPGMSIKEWKESLLKTFEHNVEHISSYHLTFEEGTVFGKMKELGELMEISEEESEEQFNILVETCRARGYIHYEISNLCKEGYYSKHNTNYWRQINYLGLGPSAHSYNGYSRQWNVSNLSVYIDNIKSGKEVFEKEILDETKRFNEYVMTTLRTIWGVDMTYIETTFSKEMHDYLLNMASRFVKYGMIEHTENNGLILTDQGKMISDNIITELIMP